MRSKISIAPGLVVAFVASAVLLFAGCGGEEEGPLVFNECGETGILLFEGVAAEPHEPCGPCERGVLVCDAEADGGLACDDPEPENACGGCEDLEGAPGAQCLDEGEVGQWECDGQENVVCNVSFSNACGGSEPLANDPGEICGQCGLGHYVCDGGNATICTEDQGCPTAADVEATQGERNDGVRVTWRGSVWATGYRVYRDGDQIADLEAGTLSYLDQDADPAGSLENIDVSASTDNTGGVEVSWSAEPGEPSPHTYQVEIIYPLNSSPLSDSAEGYRGSEVDYFELSIDSSEWGNMGLATEFFHEEAAWATVGSVDVEVEDSDWDWVSLSATEPVISEADEHQYTVRAVMPGGDTSDPGQATGQRAHGDAQYDWSAEADGITQNFPDCAGELSCVDDDFPSDTAEKLYSFTVFGAGIDTTVFDLVASVDLLDLEVVEVDVLLEAGEPVDFTVFLVDPDGNPVSLEGVELSFEISDEEIVDGAVPDTVTTDADGEATVTLTFDDTAVDVTTTFGAPDNPRVSDTEVHHGPFSIVDSDI